VRTRRFVFEGPLHVIQQKKTADDNTDEDKVAGESEKRHVFLFDDLVLVTKKVRSHTSRKPYLFQTRINLEESDVEDINLSGTSL